MKLTCKGITTKERRCKKYVRAAFCHHHCGQDLENVTCAICFDMLWKDNYVVNDKPIFELPKCRHAFHVKCALKWITLSWKTILWPRKINRPGKKMIPGWKNLNWIDYDRIQ